ncbi:MAG: hypothetical protein KJN76_06305, partial [Eudoraea sp.]|nr:hypothetical protein [Eudoraea sp.]
MLALQWVTAQEWYTLDPKYPVHDLDPYLEVFADSTDSYSPEFILNDSTLPHIKGDKLPRFLETGITYWGKFNLITVDSLEGWTLHLEDKMIGPPAWTKSNGKVDLYAYAENKLIFHQKTGVEYPGEERAFSGKWVMNRFDLAQLPPNTPVTVVLKAQGSSFGYPVFFNLSARSPDQPYYHQIYQFNNAFNIFMFGVTFIIFLYHFLQFIYIRDRIYFWFSLWLFLCMLTQAMSVGLFIDQFPSYRYPIWMFTANSIFYTFWFFGRSFIDSRKKFPKLDKFILGLALFVLVEIVLMTLYVLFFDPKIHFTGTGIHYLLLNIYAVGSLVLSIILTFKKDLFARYFGIGSLIASIFLITGTLWSMGIIRPPFRLDPYST